MRLVRLNEKGVDFLRGVIPPSSRNAVQAGTIGVVLQSTDDNETDEYVRVEWINTTWGRYDDGNLCPFVMAKHEITECASEELLLLAADSLSPTEALRQLLLWRDLRRAVDKELYRQRLSKVWSVVRKLVAQ